MDCVCYGMFVVHFDGVNGVSVVFERMCVCVCTCVECLLMVVLLKVVYVVAILSLRLSVV